VVGRVTVVRFPTQNTSLGYRCIYALPQPSTSVRKVKVIDVQNVQVSISDVILGDTFLFPDEDRLKLERSMFNINFRFFPGIGRGLRLFSFCFLILNTIVTA
jgi:hypothetical protein